MKTLLILSLIYFLIFNLGCNNNDSSKKESNIEKAAFSPKDSIVYDDTILSY